ncbi:MAG TPA: threonine synthase [Euzebyales bacterium]|nr:threonine synthase [Euzebyales bacterium]
MKYLSALRCRGCGTEFPIEPVHACDRCFGPLEAVFDYDALAGDVTRASIAAGPATLWRYRDLLPVPVEGPVTPVHLGGGLTPLTPAPRLGEALGLDDLWLKNDTVNPTWSFKDRVVSVALTAGRAFGFDTVACASTGNLANSVAAHAASAGLDAYVFIPHDLEPAKVIASAVYEPNLVAVKGNYDDVNRLCSEVADEHGWGFVNINLRPYYAEGSKTIGFEIVEQSGWALPDQVVAPMASGSMMVKIDKAFRELVKIGLVDDAAWKMYGAQALGCSPIAAAWKAGEDEPTPVRPDTIAKSLAIGNAADGGPAIAVARRTGGDIESVTDDEIVDAMRLLARTEGIFAETAGGVTVGVLRKLAASDRIDRSARTVAVISGNGLKTLDAVPGSPTFTVRPSLDEFEDAAGLTPAAA